VERKEQAAMGVSVPSLLLWMTISSSLSSNVYCALLDELQGISPSSMSYDWMTAFGANYGNAIAESMVQTESNVGATGTIENIGAFNLRLVKCTNTIGAMSEHFPLIISPGSENSGISGYAKESKEKVNKIPGLRLEQRCLYAVYDATESNGVWTEVGLHNKNNKPGESTQYIEFYFRVSEKDGHEIGVGFAPNKAQAAGAGTWVWSKNAQISKISTQSGHKKTAAMHRCSKFNDICVEASIGTGYKPRFRFVIMPMKVAGLTAMDRGHFGTTRDAAGTVVNEYCYILGQVFGYDEDADKAADSTIYKQCIA